MIIEDYVSYEVAKLLKEKGFDKDWVDGSIEKYLNGTEGYSLPTLAIAMKWLREIYNIHIVLSPNKKMNNKYSSIIFVDKEGGVVSTTNGFLSWFLQRNC